MLKGTPKTDPLEASTGHSTPDSAAVRMLQASFRSIFERSKNLGSKSKLLRHRRAIQRRQYEMASSTSKVANRLAKEKSPYLLQHQYNPVDWYVPIIKQLSLKKPMEAPMTQNS